MSKLLDKRFSKYVIAILDGDEVDLYTEKHFLDLPIGTEVSDGYSKYVITVVNGMMCAESRLGDEVTNIEIIGSDREWNVRKDETIKYPHGYNTPLWKVLNGENE